MLAFATQHYEHHCSGGDILAQYFATAGVDGKVYGYLRRCPCCVAGRASAAAKADADAFQSVRAAPIHGKVDIKALYGMASYISGSSSIEGMPISQSWVAR